MPSIRPRSSLSRWWTALVPDPAAHRILQLFVGLFVCGFGLALQIRSGLGVSPWDVLHQGLHLRTGWSIGSWSILVGILVVLLWIPLRQRPGLGTICNILFIGLAMDLTLLTVGPLGGRLLPWAGLLAGILLAGAGTGLYIGARLGPGPRDGLMTGLAERGLSIRAARTWIEIIVVGAGFLLGGVVGVGTVFFVFLIGPASQFFLERFDLPPHREGERGISDRMRRDS